MDDFVLVWVSGAIQLSSVAKRAVMRENSNPSSSGFIADVDVFVILVYFGKENYDLHWSLALHLPIEPQCRTEPRFRGGTPVRNHKFRSNCAVMCVLFDAWYCPHS